MKQFPKNARVCFVGDSITNNGIFIKHIASYYRENLPTLGVEFYNCGIAGGNLGNTLKVYDEDIDVYDPTHIVLMIGVNDSRIGNLTDPPSEERYNRLLEAYGKYVSNMESFYRLTRDKGIELILCTPMPYAEFQESEESIYRGGFALLQGYAEFVRGFAKDHGLSLCDYHRAATRAMQSSVIYRPDRVHPSPDGHVLMAKVFLEALGINYEGADSFSEEIERWYSVTQDLRGIITTEFLTVPGYYELDDKERYERISQKHDDIKNGRCEASDYIASRVETYLKTKDRQMEYVEYVKRFMKTGEA